MTLWSDLFPGKSLITRTFYNWQAGAYTITAPAKTTIIRASLIGGGAQHASAAFARVKTTAAAAELFTLSVGGVGENTVLTRNTGSVIICRADGAEVGVAGTVAASIGDTKRAGSAVAPYDAPGDDVDDFPLGFGGGGAFVDAGPTGNVDGFDWRAAFAGAGGDAKTSIIAGNPFEQATFTMPGGQGRACLEFFVSDPGYA